MGIAPGPTLRGSRQSEEHFQAQRAATVLGRGSNPADIARINEARVGQEDPLEVTTSRLAIPNPQEA